MNGSRARWQRAQREVEQSGSLEAAAAHLEPYEASWLVERWSGSLVDLVDLAPGQSVLVLRGSPGGELRHAAEAGARVCLRSPDPAHQGFVDAWLGDHGGATPPWDLVVVGDGAAWGTPELRAALRRAVDEASAGCTVMAVVDNPFSLLRIVDRRAGRPVGAHPAWLGRVVSDLRGAGLVIHQRFGLFRSTVAPTTAFDLDAREAAAAALVGTTPLMRGPRRLMTSAGAAAARRGVAAPLASGWMVLAGTSGRGVPELGVTGRIASLHSDESKIILGEPPQALEKRHRDLEAADASVMALEVLGEVLPGIAPALLDRPDPLSVRMSWVDGSPLSPHALSEAEAVSWVRKAAEVLGRIQEATRRPDGTVLVHGDYWLGNLMVVGDEVRAVIDWADARWGDPAEDRDHLVSSFVKLDVAGPGVVGRLREVVDDHFAGGR